MGEATYLPSGLREAIWHMSEAMQAQFEAGHFGAAGTSPLVYQLHSPRPQGLAVRLSLPTDFEREPMGFVDFSKPSTETAPPGADPDLTATCLVVTAAVAAMSASGPALLSGYETARLAEFLSADAERRFVAGARLLRLVVSRLTGQHPAEVEVDRRCPDCGRSHGRPLVGRGELHVSVSHSGEAVQVACTRVAPVGVDIQARGSRVTPAMRALLGRDRDPHTTAEDFLTTWTRIEAVVKATGEGLRVPLDEVRVSRPHQPPRLESYRGEPLPCQLLAQRQSSDLIGSVAVLSEGPVELVELSALDFLGTHPD